MNHGRSAPLKLEIMASAIIKTNTPLGHRIAEAVYNFVSEKFADCDWVVDRFGNHMILVWASDEEIALLADLYRADGFFESYRDLNLTKFEIKD